MTDRIKALTVALEHDMREDDVESLVEAIKHFRGVLAVELNVSTPDDWSNRQQISHELRMKLFEVLE